MDPILIVAYGNPLRSDDGVAWRAAEALQKEFCGSEVLVTRLHQPGPELAEAVSRMRAVIFVDASSEGERGTVRCEPVRMEHAGGNYLTHAFSPATVMAIAEQVYGARPPAFCAMVTGHNFSHGETLSRVAEAAVPALIERIKELVQSLLLQPQGTCGLHG